MPLRTDTTYSTHGDRNWGAAHRALANFVTDGGIATVHSSANSAAWHVASRLDPKITIIDVSKNPLYNAGTYQIRCPVGAMAGANTYNMTIVDAAENILWSGYRCKIDGGYGNPVKAGSVIEYFLGRFDALNGDLDSPFLNTHHASRYQWGLLEGRLWETALTGGPRFQHVMRGVISCNLARSVGPKINVGQPPFCHQTDFYALTAGHLQQYTGEIPFGMRLAIPRNFDLNSFRVGGRALNANQTAVAIALRDYGMVTRDTTGLLRGRSQIALNFEPAVAQTNPRFLRDVDAAMPVLVPYLAVVMNTSMTYPYNGTGGPIAIGPPPFGPQDI